MTSFQQAVRRQKKLRLAIEGPSGSGKTFTALLMAAHIGKNIFVIDTEFGSASLYAGEVVEGIRLEFQHATLSTFAPQNYIHLMNEAKNAGAEVIIIDSLSHAWAGKFGVLEIVGKNYRNWDEGTRQQNDLINTILALPCHVIATLRSKTEYVFDPSEKDKNKVVTKVGTKAIQREGVDYEFDVVMMMSKNHDAEITKTRCRELSQFYSKPGREPTETLLKWLNAGQPSTLSPVAAAPLKNIPTPDPRPVYEPPGVSDAADPTTTEAELKAAVMQHLSQGDITREMYHAWRKDHRLADSQPLDAYHLQVLLGDIQNYKNGGGWLELPFELSSGRSC